MAVSAEHFAGGHPALPEDVQLAERGKTQADAWWHSERADEFSIASAEQISYDKQDTLASASHYPPPPRPPDPGQNTPQPRTL